MALQSTGEITLAQIAAELKMSPGTVISMGQAEARKLAKVPTGEIKMSDFYGKANISLVTFDYIVIGGGGAEGNGSVGGGNIRTGTSTILETPLHIAVGARNQDSVAFGVTATRGNSGSNAGGAHWGWDGSTNCDAWPGGPGGGVNGAAGNSGGGPDVREYHAAGGNGGDGWTWPINGVTYSGGQGGYRDGAGVGNPGSHGAGYNNLGGGNKGGGVIVSYVSTTQLLNGGTITQAGGRFYHTFTSNGTLSNATG